MSLPRHAATRALLRPMALLLLVLGLPGSLSADEIWLTNGNRLEGKYQQLDGERAEIQLSFGTMVLPLERIDRVVPAATLAEEVAELLAQLPANDAQSRYEIARWCRDQGDYTLAHRLLEETLKVDPDHAAARRDLGFHLEDGRWVTEEELHQLRGEVPFRGQWLSPQERDWVLAQEAAAATHRSTAALQQAQLELEALRLRVALTQLQTSSEPAGEVGLPFYPSYGYVAPYATGFPYTGAPDQHSGNHHQQPGAQQQPHQAPSANQARPQTPRSHRAGRQPYSTPPR